MKSYLASGDLGDVVASLPVIRRLGRGILYLKSTPEICKPMTEGRFNALASLLKTQHEIIEDVRWHQGEKIDHDFTGFRICHSTRHTLTQAQAAYVSPQKAPDVTTPWLKLSNVIKHGRPVIARSPRYHNDAWVKIWPEIIKMHPDALFVGLMEEHAAFEKQLGCKVEYKATENLLELAHLIAGASIFIGNQSAPNAIAEALKVDMLVETHPRIQDVVYPRRENCHYIVTAQQWLAYKKTRIDRPILLALQCCPHDQYQAEELVRLLGEIGTFSHSGIEFALCVRRDTNPELCKSIIDYVTSFGTKSHLIKSKRFGTGYPLGPNDLWHETMRQVEQLRNEGKTQAEAVLTFEPDCIPLRNDWIDVLHKEWRRAKALGKELVGHAHDGKMGDKKDGVVTHINGNALFSIGFCSKYRLNNSNALTGWDVEYGKLLLEKGLDSIAVYQVYRIHDKPAEFFESLRKFGQVPALFHGVKDQSGIRAVREWVSSGTFPRRHELAPPEPTASTPQQPAPAATEPEPEATEAGDAGPALPGTVHGAALPDVATNQPAAELQPGDQDPGGGSDLDIHPDPDLGHTEVEDARGAGDLSLYPNAASSGESDTGEPGLPADPGVQGEPAEPEIAGDPAPAAEAPVEATNDPGTKNDRGAQKKLTRKPKPDKTSS